MKNTYQIKIGDTDIRQEDTVGVDREGYACVLKGGDFGFMYALDDINAKSIGYYNTDYSVIASSEKVILTYIKMVGIGDYFKKA